MMRFASLGSGSRGNALLVEAGGKRVMLDCGFKFAEAVARLQRLGCAAEDVDAIVVTHEHDDHIGGVARFAARVGIPVYMTPGTLAAVAGRFEQVDCRCFAVALVPAPSVHRRVSVVGLTPVLSRSTWSRWTARR